MSNPAPDPSEIEYGRRPTREVMVGNIGIGGRHPVRVQSMTMGHTGDIDATLKEINEIVEAGAELIRVAVLDDRSVAALPEVKAGCPVPLIADIHFKYKYGLAAIDAGVDKIRINPGNIKSEERFKKVIEHARDNGVPMRIGVNAGSLEKEILDKYGEPSPEALVESALKSISYCDSLNYDDIIISMKSSDVKTAVRAARLFSQKSDYPLHLGITEAGAPPYGVIKSAAGLGALLVDGIGDTIRISLTAPSPQEIDACYDLLKATGRRVLTPEIIACPTCGRIQIDLEKAVAMVEERMKGHSFPIKISILGCVVNGPGEAREADIGLAGGDGLGIIYVRGELKRKVKEEDMIDALMEEVEIFKAEQEALTATPS